MEDLILKEDIISGFIQGIIALLIAVLAGLFALSQVRINIRLSAKAKWLEEFKKNISEYITAMAATANHYRQYEVFKNSENSKHLAEKEFELYAINLTRKSTLYYQIVLDLDNTKGEFDEIKRQLNTINNHLNSPNIKQLTDNQKANDFFDLENELCINVNKILNKNKIFSFNNK